MIADTTNLVAEQIGNAVGTGTPEEQLVGALVIAAFVIVTSSIGLVGTVILVPFVLIFAGIGILRLIPIVDGHWPL